MISRKFDLFQTPTIIIQAVRRVLDVTDDDDLLRDLERRDGGMLESKFCGATIGARSSAVQH